MQTSEITGFLEKYKKKQSITKIVFTEEDLEVQENLKKERFHTTQNEIIPYIITQLMRYIFHIKITLIIL